MKKHLKLSISVFTTIVLMSSLGACQMKVKQESNVEKNAIDTPIKRMQKKQLSKEFKGYWYAGNAEITSYKLEMARYGEIREGASVLVYVTEPFAAKKQVKADQHHASNIPVLKLNSTKKFLTGLYPYSIMTSTFYPVHDNQHAIKVTNTVQEWCGHVFAQLNNREKFDITSYSYFESDGDQQLQLEKSVLENEIWTKIRINPESLPLGTFNAIPSFEFIRLKHKETKAYEASASLTNSNGISTYTINYPELERTLAIKFSSVFPYSIEAWEETSKSGFGPNAKNMTTKGTKIKRIKTAYWKQHNNEHLVLRDSLGL